MSRREALCRIGRATCALVVLILLPLSRPALSSEEPATPEVDVRVEADPRVAEVGDPIRITLEIFRPDQYQVQLPEIGNQLGDFTVLEFSPGPIAADTGSPNKRHPQEKPPETPGKTPYRARVVVALYKTGDFTFPPLKIVLKHPDGSKTSVSSPEVGIKIRSILEKNDLKLRSLKKQAEIPEPTRWLYWAGAALALVILSALALWWWRRRKRPPVPVEPVQRLDPLAAAEAALRDLLSRNLLQQGLIKQFYVLLAEIAKKVLEGGYGIQTLEKTTAEILEELGLNSSGSAVSTSQHEDEQQGDLIASLLTSCDMVKFAKYLPSRAEAELAIEQTLRLLERCRQLRASATEGLRSRMEGAA